MDYIKSIRPKLGHDKIILNCAGAVVCREGKILLQRRSDNAAWGFTDASDSFQRDSGRIGI